MEKLDEGAVLCCVAKLNQPNLKVGALGEVTMLPNHCVF
jgi:hypothetical protein